jgi:hypothetical protein
VDEFNEYGDLDAISCANGDFNTWEENQVFLDHEGYEDDFPFDDEQVENYQELEDQHLDSIWEDRFEAHEGYYYGDF